VRGPSEAWVQASCNMAMCQSNPTHSLINQGIMIPSCTGVANGYTDWQAGVQSLRAGDGPGSPL